MVDSCTVTRPGEPATDPETGVVAPSSTVVHSGRCKVQLTLSQPKTPNSAGHVYTVQDLRLDLPTTAGPVRVDDVVTVDASVMDAQLVGRVFRVSGLFHKSFATAQRCKVEEVTA